MGAYADQMPGSVPDACRECGLRDWCEFGRDDVEGAEPVADSLHEWLNGGNCPGAAEGNLEGTNTNCQNELVAQEPRVVAAHFKELGALMSGQLLVRQAEQL